MNAFFLYKSKTRRFCQAIFFLYFSNYFNLITLLLKLSTTATLGTSKKVAIVERLKEEWTHGLSAKKEKMAVVQRWPFVRFDCITWYYHQFFLAFRELKIATNCTIKHSYTDWNRCGNTTEYRRLLCFPRQICRFSKIAAQSQAISCTLRAQFSFQRDF